MQNGPDIPWRRDGRTWCQRIAAGMAVAGRRQPNMRLMLMVECLSPQCFLDEEHTGGERGQSRAIVAGTIEQGLHA